MNTDKEYLIKHRILYRRDPVDISKAEVYPWGWFFEEGTRECFTLFNTKAKINTYKSFKWHLYVLWFLNPKLSQDGFKKLAEHLADKKNGYVIFQITQSVLESMIYSVSMEDLEKQPPNRLRKVIFKDFCKLTPTEKQSITASLLNRSKITSSDVYDAMLLLNENNEKITVTKLAKALKVSTRTLYRHLTNELKKEKALLNEELTKTK